MIRINGKSLNINKINEISIRGNNNLIINDDIINLKDYTNNYVVNIEVEGDVDGNISTSGDVSIKGNCKNIDTTGNVEVSGDVNGDVDTTGNINCYGDINGNIDSTGNVSLKRK